jgi:hypothetical protein
MSRSYRIKVRESLNRVLRVEDHVESQLELLEILPCEQMAGLLAAELARRGFRQDGELLVREKDGVRVEVNSADGTVTVSAQDAQKLTLTGEKEGLALGDRGASARQAKKTLRGALKKDLEKQAEEQTAALRGKVTDRLEGQLHNLSQELDQTVNRVTAEALKIKAAQLGQIKQLTEDPQSGSLTIVLEV